MPTAKSWHAWDIFIVIPRCVPFFFVTSLIHFKLNKKKPNNRFNVTRVDGFQWEERQRETERELERRMFNGMFNFWNFNRMCVVYVGHSMRYAHIPPLFNDRYESLIVGKHDWTL